MFDGAPDDVSEHAENPNNAGNMTEAEGEKGEEPPVPPPEAEGDPSPEVVEEPKAA